MARKKATKKALSAEIVNTQRPIVVKKQIINHHNSSHFWIFGSSLAMILSYERSASILWAIAHGIFSWFYILYRALQILGL
jgi:hypothetical protein